MIHKNLAGSNTAKGLKKQHIAPTDVAVYALEDKKGVEIKTIQLKNSYTDTLVVATGNSSAHVQTLANHVEEYFRKAHITVEGIEGMPNNQWVIVDAGDVVVHIFTEEMRDHYRIEKLYAHDFDDDDDLAEQEEQTGTE